MSKKALGVKQWGASCSWNLEQDISVWQYGGESMAQSWLEYPISINPLFHGYHRIRSGKSEELEMFDLERYDWIIIVLISSILFFRHYHWKNKPSLSNISHVLSKELNYWNQCSNKFKKYLQARGQGNHKLAYPAKEGEGSKSACFSVFFSFRLVFLVDHVKKYFQFAWRMSIFLLARCWCYYKMLYI